MTDLQVSVESGDGLERKMRVQVPAARIDAEIDSRLNNVGRSARIKGFRPGKAPAKVIRQHYGAQIRQEVVQEIVQATYSEAVSLEQLKPAAGPAIEALSVDEGADLAYTATFEVYPEIQLTGLSEIEVTRLVPSIEDADLDKMLERLREQRSRFDPVDRAAVDGDQVKVDFNGSIDGEPLAGGQGEDVAIVLGQGQMLPEFESAVTGLKSGDTKTFGLTFPEDYHSPEIAGQQASFDLTVKEVAAPALPDVDTEFVKALGIDSGELDDLRADMRRNMEREATERSRAHAKGEVLEGLLTANPIALPGVLVEQEAKSLQEEAGRQAGQSEQPLPPLEDFMSAAEKRVRIGLLIGALVSDRQLVVDRDRVKAKVDELCAPYDQPDEVAKMYFQNPQLLAQVENFVLEDQVIDSLLAEAQVTDKPCAFDELMSV